MNSKDLINEAISLPLDERARLWLDEAVQRLSEIRSGDMELISGEIVFEGIQKRFDR